MAGTDDFDGKGTIWVHDSPVGGPEREEVPPAPAPSPSPAAPPPTQAPIGGPPAAAPMPTQAPSSGMGSTGCLLAVFALGGLGLGLVVLLAIGVVGAAFYFQ